MSVREKLNSSKAFGFGLAGLLILVASVQAARYFYSGGRHVNPTGAFYTDDDGQTYFSDTLFRFAPWDHDGKTANLAFVYSSDKGNFVAYQERYIAAAQKVLRDAYAKVQSGEQSISEVAKLLSSDQIGVGGMEIKMRGSDKWMPRSRMLQPHVRAPDGGDCIIVMP